MSIPSPKRSNLFSTIWSKFNLRRREKKEFKNVAHGLIPAATIGPRFGVPRTPPPLSPNHSPERPRSALAIATSSSSPTAGTVARPRSQSESRGPCPDIKTGVELHAATGRYSSSDRDRRPGSKTESHVFSLEHSCDEAESDKYEGSEQEEEHVYQSLETQRKADDMNEVYAVLLKHNKGRTSSDTELTEDTVFDIVSPMYSEGEIVFQKGTVQTQPSSLRQLRSASNESMASSDLSDHMSRQSHNSTFKKLKKKKPYKKENRVKRTESDISPDNSESLRCELEERQALITELREQARVQVEEKEILERRCLQQREQIEALQIEISCKERTSTDNSESLRCELEAQQALVTELREQARVQVDEKEMLRKRCLQQSEQIEALQLKISPSCKEANPTGNDSVSLRQQAEELEDENIQLKTTVHRLNMELSKYQAKFRPLTKDENSHLKVLLGNRPAPPWLFDMKYLSPLLLAYEDHLNASAEQLKSCEEELQALRARTEEIIKENENLHSQISQDSSIELKQIKEMAHLVLEENQVLLEQLELQQVKSKEVHSKHAQEVFKASKQVMLLESENQNLEKEMERERKEHFALKTEFHRIRLALENSLSLVEHNAVTEKLKRQLQEQDRKTNSEIEELMTRLSALETEKKFLLLDKNTLSTDIKHMETELQHSEQAKRKAQRHINILKQEVKDSLEKELIAHQYLASIVTLAEKSTHERDQLLHMTSSLENNKQGILANILEGTVNLGKLQEKVKVYKQQASASVGAMGRRLHEQEEDFAGKAASYQREIRHLQSQLRDRQEQLHGAMQQKREVEGELEVVYEAATRESQRLREVVLRGGSQGPAAVTPVLHGVSGQ